jgi:hypothetical protein
MIEHKDDTRRLKQALAYRAEEIACHLFGKPSSRTRVELRFGGHGSTAVTVAGSKAGRFHSFEAGVGGSMIDAIMFAHDCNLSRAFEIAREYVGEEWVPPPKPILVDVDEVVSGKQREALDIWHASRLIDGTPAETYLRGRGIDAKCWPASLRWNSRIGALVVAAQDAAGDVVGIQRILLRADGTAKRDAKGRQAQAFSWGRWSRRCSISRQRCRRAVGGRPRDGTERVVRDRRRDARPAGIDGEGGSVRHRQAAAHRRAGRRRRPQRTVAEGAQRCDPPLAA